MSRPTGSFRGRLALRLAGAVLVLAVTGSAVGYVILREILYERLDSLLLRLAGIEAAATADSPDDQVHFHDEVFLSTGSGHETILSRYAEVWTLEGEPVVRTNNLDARDLPFPASVREQAGAASRPVLFDLSWEGQAYRSIVYPLGLAGPQHRLHLLQVAVSTRETDTVLGRVLFLLTILTLVGTAVGGALAWWLAGRAFRPVTEIIWQAEHLEASDPGHQITARAETEELRRLVAVLNAMLGRIDSVLGQQHEFLADAGHAIKTPLTVLRGDIQVALRQPRSEDDYQKILHQALDDLREISDLAEDLITLARGDSGALTPDPTKVSVPAVLRRVAAKYRGAAEQAGVEIEVLSPDLTVHTDEELLERAISNLVDNAVKYGRPDGHVTLTAEASNPGVTIQVSDDGPGMSAEESSRIFERFVRGENARRNARGSGLGLAIVRTVAERLRAEIDLQSKVGVGTTVRLALPRAGDTENANS